MKDQFKYVLHDGRYHSDPDRSTVLGTADTLEEAREDKSLYSDAVIVRYKESGIALSNPEIVE